VRRKDLEHLIRAAAAIADQAEIVVVGSQSILGAVPDAPAELLLSMEADLYPLHRPELAAAIEGAIGEGSPFQATFGYYAQGVGPETAVLPEGWRDRAVTIQGASTDQKIGYCPEPHDLAASKLAAGRDKDRSFVSALLRHRIVSPPTLGARIAALPIPPEQRERIAAWAAAEAGRVAPST
jgi:hypothetical protein